MGFIWNILLSFSHEEFWTDGEEEPRDTCEPLERINEWIPNGKLVSLTGPTYVEGVGYGMDANLFGGGYKHFDIEGFIKVVEAQVWKDPARVQLWIKGAVEGMRGEESFTLVKLRRRRSIAAKPKAKPSPKAKPKLRTTGERKKARERSERFKKLS